MHAFTEHNLYQVGALAQNHYVDGLSTFGDAYRNFLLVHGIINPRLVTPEWVRSRTKARRVKRSFRAILRARLNGRYGTVSSRGAQFLIPRSGFTPSNDVTGVSARCTATRSARPGFARPGAQGNLGCVDTAFTKMQGLGNDFVVVDGTRVPLSLSAERIRRLADRRLGVGCDQVLLVERPTRPDVDARCRIFNADGTEVEQCGNGVRCVARYLRDSGMVGKDALTLETLGGVVHVRCGTEGDVEVEMGLPRFAPRDIPLLVEEQALSYELDLDDGSVSVSAVSMGNPHAVIRVPDVAAAPVERVGAALSRHWRFPQGANVGFMQLVDRAAVRLRVYERGVGETPACGTGACAAVVAGRLHGLLDEQVAVALPGGVLTLRWAGTGHSVVMSGPAARVFDGRILL